MQLFESLQYLDDALLTKAPAVNSRRVWLRWGTAVAAFVLVTGAVLALPRLRSGGEVPAPAAGSGEVYWTELPQIADETARPIQPGGVPGPGAAPDAAPVPDVLAWNDVDETRRGIASDVAGVMMVGEPLTGAQIAVCAPEIRLEWMDGFTGFAAYYLKGGAGGLAYIEMTVPHEGVGTYTVRLRDVNAPEMPSCYPVQGTDSVGSLGGQAYRAYRLRYFHGEGDPAQNPPEAWTEMQVVFEREEVVYTLTAAVPQALEDAAAIDLRDLLLAYAGSHGVPDLGAFHCGEHLCRDDTLTLPEALADPDFGAYLPEEGPEGFGFDFARRYQFEEAENYLMAFWTRGRADLEWLIKPVTAEARSRVVSPEERERYDWNLYPVPWSAYAAQEDWATVENPVFRIGDLSPELIAARVHIGDEGQTMFRFGVLYDSGVLVEVNVRDVPAEWVCEALTQMQ
jgi:hypothetical protein